MKTSDGAASNDDEFKELRCHMKRETAVDDMKESGFAVISKNENSRYDFGVEKSGIDESGLLKKLTELNIDSSKDRDVNVSNRRIRFDPSTKDEEGQNYKHEVEQ